MATGTEPYLNSGIWALSDNLDKVWLTPMETSINEFPHEKERHLENG